MREFSTVTQTDKNTFEKERITMASFLSSAGRQTKDIRQFLREAAGGNSLKYKPAKGQKHLIYVPFKSVPTVNDAGETVINKEIIAMSGAVHEWTGPDGKYKATVCLKDVVRNDEAGTVLNDGSCPFCDSVSKAWDVYRYRMEQEEATCGKTGDELVKHLEGMKKTFADERKAKDAREYIYLLVALYRTDPTKNYSPIMGQNGLPEFDLKVMKLSASRVEKLQQQMENSGAEFVGSEMVFEYPNEDDARLVVSQSTTAPVFESKQFIRKYTGLAEAIQAEVDKFEWDGIEKSFPEWNGMTSNEAAKTVDQLFNAWDNFQLELATNPNAKYLEYIGTKGTGTNPAIGQIPAAPQIGVAPSTVPNVPGVNSTAPVGIGIPDANEIFGNGPTVPSVGNDEINI